MVLTLATLNFLRGGGTRLLTANAAHICVVLMLVALTCKTPRFNQYIGNLLLISFFLTNSMIYQFEEFEDALRHHLRGIAMSNFFVILLDRSWLLSCLASAVPVHIFWTLHKDVAGAALQTMLEINVAFSFFMLLSGWWIQFYKRKLFYQSVCMERSSNRWLGFLKAHPDPIIVLDEQDEILFRNEDCDRVFATELRDLDLSGQESLKSVRERLFGLRVD